MKAKSTIERMVKLEVTMPYAKAVALKQDLHRILDQDVCSEKRNRIQTLAAALPNAKEEHNDSATLHRKEAERCLRFLGLTDESINALFAPDTGELPGNEIPATDKVAGSGTDSTEASPDADQGRGYTADAIPLMGVLYPAASHSDAACQGKGIGLGVPLPWARPPYYKPW